MNVLLTTINSKFIHQNLAIRLLYMLNRNYNNLYWKEFINKDKIDEIAEYCSDYHLVAFSCYIWNITKIIEVSSKIKLLNSDCKILLGGPEVSHDWSELIKLNTIDFIIYGEGEIPFSALLKSYPNFENVTSLVYKSNNKVVENKPSEKFDLNNFTNVNPYISDSEQELKHKVCYIETSRGCPHACEYCLAALDNKIRYLPFETTLSNLKFLIERGITIKFLDRTFNISQKYAISLFQFILENRKPENIFQFEIKADILQHDLIDFIIQNVPKGIFRFEIGIQTLNEKTNDSINRKQNFENIQKFIQQIEHKIEIHLDLIIGLPYDYWNDIRFCFEKVFKLFAPELQLGFLKFLKGTPIRYNADLHEYKYNSFPPYQIISSKYLSIEEIEKLNLLEHVLEIYWNKKRCIHTLKYIALNYSVFDFLLGLGLYYSEKETIHNNIFDIFQIISDYARLNYSDNTLFNLIAIDYYLQHKIKPKVLLISEIDKRLKNQIIEKLSLNHHKYRFVFFYINFKIKKFIDECVIDYSDEIVIIQYDGKNMPQLISYRTKCK